MLSVEEIIQDFQKQSRGHRGNMKSNDIFESSDQLDELRLSNLIGGAAASKAKSMFGGGGKSSATILAQDIFVKDFVSDAVSALENAIASGLIAPPQPGGKETAPPASPEAQPQAQQAQPQAQQAAAPAKAARPQGDGGKAQAARIQAMNNYLKGVSQQMSKITDVKQKQELSKELMNYMMDRQGTPEWENGLKTVEFILNKNLDPRMAQGMIGQLKRPLQQKQELQRQNPGSAPKSSADIRESRWQTYWMNQLAEACGFTLKQLGFTTLIENKYYRIVESRFYKMNKILESVILLEQGQTFDQFFKDWFGQYMQGVDFSANKPALYAIVDQITDAYNNQQGKIDRKNIEKLAQGGWAASKAVGINPSGAQDAAGGQAQPAAAGAQAQPAAAGAQAQPAAAGAQAQPAQAKAAGGAENGYQIAQRVKSELNKLYKIDQVVYNDLVKSLQQKPVKTDEPPAVAMTGQEKPNTLGGAGYTSPQSQQQKVSESAKRAERLKKLLARD